jgi:hypothetical protein
MFARWYHAIDFGKMNLPPAAALDRITTKPGEAGIAEVATEWT